MCLYDVSLPVFFFFNDTATTEIYTLSLHDALPICISRLAAPGREQLEDIRFFDGRDVEGAGMRFDAFGGAQLIHEQDRKSTRLNSSHGYISYAVFCLKKKTKKNTSR